MKEAFGLHALAGDLEHRASIRVEHAMIRFQPLAGLALAAMLVVTVRPAEARFVSVDPVKPDTNTGENFNRYHYGNNNPYRYTDPDGRQSRELNFEAAQSGHQPPPRHPDDYLGPAIGAALTGVLAAPIIGFGGGAAIANPAAATRVLSTAADIGMGDALGGASLGGDIAIGAQVIQTYGPFHRLGDSPAAIQSIRASGEIFGNPARNTHQSHIPKVRAYLGSLPAGAHGFEFTTPIAPDIGHVPWKPTWSPGSPGVVERNGQAVIPCTVTTSSC